ncbi:MAG: DsrE family protein, partial [bacterium]|nr:DsrE family protein [bacterium]
QGDQASVFLLAKGVDCQSLDSDNFKVSEQMQTFHDQGGNILACGTCLKMRHKEGTEMCPLSSMKDLYEMIKTSDKVVSF